jgi:hypothetical protein
MRWMFVSVMFVSVVFVSVMFVSVIFVSVIFVSVMFVSVMFVSVGTVMTIQSAGRLIAVQEILTILMANVMVFDGQGSYFKFISKRPNLPIFLVF